MTSVTVIIHALAFNNLQSCANKSIGSKIDISCKLVILWAIQDFTSG